MTNEEAKREAILSRWIECGYSSEISNQIDVDGWKKVKFRELPSTKNGLFETKEDLRDGGLPTFYFRPQSIRPIETNNGWTRIEPDGSNLPTTGSYYFLNMDNHKDDCKNMYQYDSLRKDQFARWFTHFRAIPEIPKAIY